MTHTQKELTSFKETLKIIRRIIKKGNTSNILIKTPDKQLIFKIPCSIAALSLYFLPFIAGLSSALLIYRSWTLSIEGSQSHNQTIQTKKKSTNAINALG